MCSGGDGGHGHVGVGGGGGGGGDEKVEVKTKKRGRKKIQAIQKKIIQSNKTFLKIFLRFHNHIFHRSYSSPYLT